MLRGSIASAQQAVVDAKANLQKERQQALAEMLNGGRFGKRSLAALAAGIGMTEPETAELIMDEFPHAERTTGRRTGKVYYGL